MSVYVCMCICVCSQTFRYYLDHRATGTKVFKSVSIGMGCSSEAEHLPNMPAALGSTASMEVGLEGGGLYPSTLSKLYKEMLKLKI